MRNRKTFWEAICQTLIFLQSLAAPCAAFAQTPRVEELVVLSPLVGPEIDLTEKHHNRLWPNIPDSEFGKARILRYESGGYLLVLAGKKDTSHLLISEAEIEALRTRVAQRNRALLAAKEQLDTCALPVTAGIARRGGQMYQGRIIARGEDGLVLETDLGTLTFSWEQIQDLEFDMTPAETGKGTFYPPNPHPTRYFFGPSGFGLKKGEGYYQNTYVGLNTIYFGVSDNITLGGGTELFSLLLGRQPILVLAPKASFEISPRLHAATGVLAAVPLKQNMAGVVVGYGVLTLGSTEQNLSFGAGYGYYKEHFFSYTQWTATKAPILTLSGMSRLSKRVSLISENWMVPVQKAILEGGTSYEIRTAYDPVLSLGVRLMQEKTAFDIALVTHPILIEEDIPGIPFIDFTYKF